MIKNQLIIMMVAFGKNVLELIINNQTLLAQILHVAEADPLQTDILKIYILPFLCKFKTSESSEFYLFNLVKEAGLKK